MSEFLNTHNASILLSVVNKSHYPQDDLPEIALAGRSNVGKSSFINTLLGRKNLARTSSKPGKTQSLNFYNIDDKLRFVDVPGYGYAKVSKKERAKWGKMIEEYLTSRENLRAVVSLVDFRHDPSSTDEKMIKASLESKSSFFFIADSCLFHLPRGTLSAFVATKITGIS